MRCCCIFLLLCIFASFYCEFSGLYTHSCSPFSILLVVSLFMSGLPLSMIIILKDHDSSLVLSNSTCVLHHLKLPTHTSSIISSLSSTSSLLLNECFLFCVSRVSTFFECSGLLQLRNVQLQSQFPISALVETNIYSFTQAHVTFSQSSLVDLSLLNTGATFLSRGPSESQMMSECTLRNITFSPCPSPTTKSRFSLSPLKTVHVEETSPQNGTSTSNAPMLLKQSPQPHFRILLPHTRRPSNLFMSSKKQRHEQLLQRNLFFTSCSRHPQLPLPV